MTEKRGEVIIASGERLDGTPKTGDVLITVDGKTVRIPVMTMLGLVNLLDSVDAIRGTP